LYFAAGDLATNQRLTERLVRIVRDMGFEPATPTEARDIFGLSRKTGPKPEFAIR
jgi:3-keto-5-aminohexanoate cleavage enzyme